MAAAGERVHYGMNTLVAQLAAWTGRRLAALHRPVHPLWRAGRLLLMLVLTFVLCLAPLHLQPGSARWWAPGVLLAPAILLAGGSAVLGRLAAALLRQAESVKVLGQHIVLPRVEALQAERWLQDALRRVGVAIPALLFFTGWALVYATVWAWSPADCPVDPDQSCTGAFGGISDRPIFGTFLYLATNMAFANPVPDLLARSTLTHALTTVEVISGIGLATVYAVGFFGTPAIRR